MPHVHFYTGTDKKFEYIIIFCLYIMSRRATEFGYIMKIHKITLNIKQPLYLAGFLLGHIKSSNTLSFTVSNQLSFTVQFTVSLKYFMSELSMGMFLG